MTFVDSNIPMYLVGAAHPRKIDAQQLLERTLIERSRLVTDAEVLQEILHRYVAIGRRDAIHLAIMEPHGIRQIMSFNTKFDGYPGVERLAGSASAR